VIRPSRVAAIAWQDLRAELKGRQGMILPGVVTALLLPASLVPSPARQVADSIEGFTVNVSGDVPADVLESPEVNPRSSYRLEFRREPDVLLVDGMVIPETVRAALDGGQPVVTLHPTVRGYVFPGRTLLLSLITASTLTGAVSQSIGGERSRRTLVVLLAAAISRAEIVLGKWAAWAGFGVLSAYLAAGIALATGNVEPGLWLIPLPWVPAATVAIALWLVRRAGDVMAGSATTLRVLPAVLSITAVVAWLLGHLESPWLGALVPLGGALIAAGNTWPSIGPVLLATASTAALTVAALAGTIRDLEESGEQNGPEDPLPTALLIGTVATLVWWLPIAGPGLWRLAGNPRITEALDEGHGLLAGALGLLLISAVRAARCHGSWLEELQIRRIAVGAWLEAGLAAGVLWASGVLDGLLPKLVSGPLADRLSAVVQPSPELHGWTVSILVIVADELLFRGWLAKAVGPLLATLVWIAVRSPTDPVQGAVVGMITMMLMVRGRSVGLPIAARIGALALGVLGA
jgi:ABC-2 family transporter protein